MSEELSDLAASAEPAEIVTEMIHPHAVDFLVHAIGLEVGFQLLSQQEAVALGDRIFRAYWHNANVKASQDSLSLDRITLDTPISDLKLKPAAISMLDHLKSCLNQSRHYLKGVDMATLARHYYPPSPGSSRIAAYRSLSQNIRTIAGGIAQLNRTLYKGNLLGTIIEEWRREDPNTLPTIFSQDQSHTEPALTLEYFGGQLPRDGTSESLGIVVIARSVSDSPLQRRTAAQTAPQSRSARPPVNTRESAIRTPAVLPVNGLGKGQIEAARILRKKGFTHTQSGN